MGNNPDVLATFARAVCYEAAVGCSLVPTTTTPPGATTGDQKLTLANTGNWVHGTWLTWLDGTLDTIYQVDTVTESGVTLVDALQMDHAPGALLACNIVPCDPVGPDQAFASGFPYIGVAVTGGGDKQEGREYYTGINATVSYELPLQLPGTPTAAASAQRGVEAQSKRVMHDVRVLIERFEDNYRMATPQGGHVTLWTSINYSLTVDTSAAMLPVWLGQIKLVLFGTSRTSNR